MRVLITGMDGFAGRYLAELLLRETHWHLIGISRSTDGERASNRVQWWRLDLRDPDGVRRLMKYERPDLVIHLAAQSHVPTAWKDPWATIENNLRGQINLLEGILINRLTPRVLIVTSNEVYGAPALSSDLPFTEASPLRPNNPYGVSKAAQDLSALQYHMSHKLDIVVARPFNHIGPGQREHFVASDFARQIALIEAGKQEPVMRLGNMAAQRDFTDVRDVVRAYLALIKFADGGRAYNVCSGTPRSIQSVLDALFAMTPARITVETDPAKFRPLDTPVSYGDPSRLREATGWAPAIPFEQTIADILNSWRARVAAGAA
ncbi:MAG: GDP-mannose 4,6-dehydratase [Anaerolineae bacterium]